MLLALCYEDTVSGDQYEMVCVLNTAWRNGGGKKWFVCRSKALCRLLLSEVNKYDPSSALCFSCFHHVMVASFGQWSVIF